MFLDLPSRSHFRRVEQGTTLVEFALVIVVLMTLIFGLIEGGLLVRGQNAVSNAADEGARRASIEGSSETADWVILQQLRSRGLLAAASLEYVVVYRPESPGAPPSSTCLGGTAVNGECNVYSRADFELPEADFGCTDADLDGSWCPTTRGGLGEYIGIWIEASHVSLTGVIGDARLKAGSVHALEWSI